jgi:hypothetical protein
MYTLISVSKMNDNLTLFFPQGICPSHENCSKSWDVITGVLKDLKFYHELYEIVSPSDVEYLLKVIMDLKIYVKNIFRHEIQMHSNIKVRLLKFWLGLFHLQ